VIETNGLSKPGDYEALLEKYKKGYHTNTNYYLAAIVCRIEGINGWIVWGDTEELFIKSPDHFVEIKDKYEITGLDNKLKGKVEKGKEFPPRFYAKAQDITTILTIHSEPTGFQELMKDRLSSKRYGAMNSGFLGLKPEDLV